MQSIDLKEDERSILLDILQHYLPKHEVYAFGSRVTGKAKPFSDLDLVIIADSPVPSLTMYYIQNALSESSLPFRVDLVEWINCSEDFKAIIKSQWLKL